MAAVSEASGPTDLASKLALSAPFACSFFKDNYFTEKYSRTTTLQKSRENDATFSTCLALRRAQHIEREVSQAEAAGASCAQGSADIDTVFSSSYTILVDIRL